MIAARFPLWAIRSEDPALSTALRQALAVTHSTRSPLRALHRVSITLVTCPLGPRRAYLSETGLHLHSLRRQTMLWEVFGLRDLVPRRSSTMVARSAFGPGLTAETRAFSSGRMGPSPKSPTTS